MLSSQNSFNRETEQSFRSFEMLSSNGVDNYSFTSAQPVPLAFRSRQLLPRLAQWVRLLIGEPANTNLSDLNQESP